MTQYSWEGHVWFFGKGLRTLCETQNPNNASRHMHMYTNTYVSTKTGEIKSNWGAFLNWEGFGVSRIGWGRGQKSKILGIWWCRWQGGGREGKYEGQ